MANARKKNTIYVDATGDITVEAIKPLLCGLVITPSAANSEFKLKETSSTGVIIIHVKIEAIESRFLDLTKFTAAGGIELTTTFNINLLTNISSVQLFGIWTAPVGNAKG